MKVRCIRIFDTQGKEQASSPWLTVGKEYIVLELEIYPRKDALYRLVGDNSNQSPALFNASQFEIVSGSISSTWKINQLKSGALHLSPESWQEVGFWEKCYDLEPKALEIYKREARIIMEEEVT